ncbi:hypothetical protein PB257_004285 [Salmonella enterica]|nr:hypothetical protein [Salmonella enterica]
MMCNINWSEAPDWATCVVKPKINKFSVDYHWSEEPRADARMMRIETGADFTMRSEIFWEIVEKRPGVIVSKMKVSQNTMNWEDFDNAPDWATCVVLSKATNNFAWSNGSMYAPILRNPPQAIHNVDDFEIIAKRPVGSPRDVTVTPVNYDQLVKHGYSIRNNDEITKYEQPSTVTRAPRPTPPSNCRCTFTPVQQPSTASDLLKQAEQLLTERGKQYDTSGQERSSAKIVAAFNTITGRDLTPGEGWLFLMLLKAVRFYSNTETPHRDSLEDLISYAALHAEEYLNNER